MDPQIQAIGLMDLGCTVTHVGNGIAITAGHCFARSNFRGVAKNRPYDDDQYSIQWGHVEGVPSYLTSHGTQILRMDLSPGPGDKSVYDILNPLSYVVGFCLLKKKATHNSVTPDWTRIVEDNSGPVGCHRIILRYTGGGDHIAKRTLWEGTGQC